MEDVFTKNGNLSAREKYELIRDVNPSPGSPPSSIWRRTRYNETFKLALKKSLIYKILAFLFLCFLITLIIILSYNKNKLGLSGETVSNIFYISVISIVAIFFIQRRIRLHTVMNNTSIEEIEKINDSINKKVEYLNSPQMNPDVSVKNLLIGIGITLGVLILTLFVYYQFFFVK